MFKAFCTTKIQGTSSSWFISGGGCRRSSDVPDFVVALDGTEGVGVMMVATDLLVVVAPMEEEDEDDLLVVVVVVVVV